MKGCLARLWRCRGELVPSDAPAGLIIDNCDAAAEDVVAAKLSLGSCVGDAAGGCPDVHGIPLAQRWRNTEVLADLVAPS